MRNSDSQNEPFKNYHDKQVYDTKHDKIVVWAYEKLKDLETFKKLCLRNPSFETLGHAVEIETPIKNKKDYVLGYADLAVSLRYICGYSYYLNGGYKTHGEYNALTEENKLKCTKESDFSVLKFYFEVKTSVNIGETVRQINHFRAQTEALNIKWYVIAPAFSHSYVLEEQGIRFIEYPGDSLS